MTHNRGQDWHSEYMSAKRQRRELTAFLLSVSIIVVSVCYILHTIF